LQTTNNTPVIKDLVLIGGGHSHVAVLKRFGMNPIPGLQITLITRDVHTPYSGMLPGYIAGHYRYDESHIDLGPLVKFAGARLIHAPATFLELENKQVICGDRPPINYDVLSINTGSTPSHIEVPGSKQYALAVKPINEFLLGWEALMKNALESKGEFKVVVVGSGAGGVEVALATQFHLQQLLKQHGLSNELLTFDLVAGSGPILATHNTSIQKRFRRVLSERSVTIHKGNKAKRVDGNTIELDSGKTLNADAVIWATHASAPSWYKESGLAVDERGFIEINDSLQSVSHKNVFAAGDIATVTNYLRPKSGVFAVRQGPPLYKNIRRALTNKPLKKHVPQISFLSLISTGDKYAIGSRGFFTFEGAWIWKLKDYIDREFMRKYNELPEMADEKESIQSELASADALKEISAIAMRCGGCGAKVGSNVLSRVVNQLTTVKRDDVILGLDAPDDAAVLEVPPGKVQVQSVDYFRSFIDDPYVFGQIAANHSLGDVFAMGAEAQAAMAIATVPFGKEKVVEQQLHQMMDGALKVLNQHNAALIGGHSSEGAELSFGLSVTGLIEKQRLLAKGGMQVGDVIVITKPVGTGTLFAADMRGKSKGRWITQAIESMIHSNHAAAQCLYKYDVHSCTDVTGFGVLGHLVEMVRAGQVDISIDINNLPVLDGALETMQLGIFSSLQPSNVRLRRALKNQDAAIKHELYPLLFDPQTAGGLLASIPAAYQDECIAELHGLGYKHACVIGVVQKEGDSLEAILIKS
jgi:selenide,water dikinase